MVRLLTLKNKKMETEKATEKIELDGWIYFYKYKNGIFKIQPDNPQPILLAEVPSDMDRFLGMEIKNGYVYFTVEKSYSTFDEKAYEYNRYSRETTYKVTTDGKDFTEVSGQCWYLGSSD